MELAIGGDHPTFANVLKLPRSKLCNWAANFLVHPGFGKPENALGVNFIQSVCEVCSHIFSTDLEYYSRRSIVLEHYIFWIANNSQKFEFLSFGNVWKT